MSADGHVMSSESLAELATALSVFQGKMAGAPKGGTVEERDKRTNAVKRSRQYTRLCDAWDAARAVLAANGLSVIQMPGAPAEGCVSVTTRLMHKSGEWIQSTVTIPIDRDAYMNETQKYGNSITYACRYAFLAILGLPPVDDDAGAESPRNQPPPQRAPAEKPLDGVAILALVAAFNDATDLAGLKSANSAVKARIHRIDAESMKVLRDARDRAEERLGADDHS